MPSGKRNEVQEEVLARPGRFHRVTESLEVKEVVVGEGERRRRYLGAQLPPSQRPADPAAIPVCPTGAFRSPPPRPPDALAGRSGAALQSGRGGKAPAGGRRARKSGRKRAARERAGNVLFAAYAPVVNVGISHDTAEFAVESIRRWWQLMGKRTKGFRPRGAPGAA
jgi:hypothetical protein